MTRFDTYWRAALLVIATGTLPFCGASTTDTGSSESRFLQPCTSSCMDGFSCLCGICTTGCETSSGCEQRSETATCVTTSGECASPSRGRVCDMLCEQHQDCRSLGAGFRCVAGRCRKPAAADSRDAAPGEDSAAPRQDAALPDCSQIESAARQQVARAVAAASLDCSSDADCTFFDPAADCSGSCGAILSQTGARAVSRVIDDVNANLCLPTCGPGSPIFCPSLPAVVGCVAGQCTPLVDTMLGTPCSPSCGECYLPGTGENPICSARCTSNTDCSPMGLCQASGNTGRWCFRRCSSEAECLAVNGSTENPLFCAVQLDPLSDEGYGVYAGEGDGFCIQYSEP